MSHTALTYHIIICTYHREYVISENHEKELYKFIFDFSRKRDVFIRRIGGMPDNIHILCDMPATTAVADFVQIIKSESSKFMRVNPHFQFWKKWAIKYGAFTVDVSLREVRKKYIMNQKEHHRKRSFADEFRELLLEYGLTEIEKILGDKR